MKFIENFLDYVKLLTAISIIPTLLFSFIASFVAPIPLLVVVSKVATFVVCVSLVNAFFLTME